MGSAAGFHVHDQCQSVLQGLQISEGAAKAVQADSAQHYAM